ncbi:MAG: hypothetical protein WDO24_23455 [Pseudomonadota bacterium]
MADSDQDSSDQGLAPAATQANPAPDALSDAEWQNMVSRYNAMQGRRLLRDAPFNPARFLTMQDPNKPAVYFDRAGQASMTQPSVPPQSTYQALLQHLYNTLNTRSPEPTGAAPIFVRRIACRWLAGRAIGSGDAVRLADRRRAARHAARHAASFVVDPNRFR